MLAPELATDDVFRARFLKESRVAASLNHPNVIPIYDMGAHEDLLYIAMRYVAGEDLRGVLKAKHVLAPEQALLLCGQAGRALDAAHRHGLVHRDVKPGNMLVEHGSDEEDPDHVYLSDFGITKHTASRSGLTATGKFMGTIDYIAPEQIQGRPVDGRADIYSLACVLYECMTGRVPFAKDIDAAVIWAHVEEMPTAPSSLLPTLPPGIDQVMARALAKDPADRYPTCRELIAAARAAVGTTGSAPSPATVLGTSTVAPHPATVLGASPKPPPPLLPPPLPPAATPPPTQPPAAIFPLPRPARRASGHPAGRRLPGRGRRAARTGSGCCGLGALVLVIAAVGGWLIWRGTTGGSSAPAASSSPVTVQHAGWRLGPASPFPVQQLHAAVLDGRIWLAGGLTGLDQATNKTEYYDLAAHKWHAGPDLPFKVHHAMLVAYRGQLWLVGGFLPQGANMEAAASARVLILDPAKDRWVEGPALHHARAAGAAVVVGKLIVVAGGRTGGKAEQEVKPTEIYNGKSWQDAPAIPVPGDHLAAVTDGTYLYVIGGRTLSPSANHNAVQRFDPATGQWTQLTPLPVADSDLGAAYVSGQLITFGGENVLSVFRTVRAYNLATKAWSTLPNLAEARHGMGVAVIGNTIYAIDGQPRPGTTHPPPPCRPSPCPFPHQPFRPPGTGGWGVFRRSRCSSWHAAVLDGRIWLAGGLTGPDQATKKTGCTTRRSTPGVPARIWPFKVHHAMLVAYRGQAVADRWLFCRRARTCGGGRLGPGADPGPGQGPLGRGACAPSCACRGCGGGGGEQDRRCRRADRRQG